MSGLLIDIYWPSPDSARDRGEHDAAAAAERGEPGRGQGGQGLQPRPRGGPHLPPGSWLQVVQGRFAFKYRFQIYVTQIRWDLGALRLQI